MRILLIEDDENLAIALIKVLTTQYYTVDRAMDGEDGWELAQADPYDLIVLDVMLPKLDGVSLCQRLRKQGYQRPILLLTARDTLTDRIKGLDAGADDYVIKPFEWAELLARIRALLRRDSLLLPTVLQWGELCLNPATCEVTWGDRPLPLRPKEYSLLELFLRNPRRVFSCSAILKQLWSYEDTPNEETVRAHIKGLRQRLKAAGVVDVLETVYGLGYRLREREDASINSAIGYGADELEPNSSSDLQQALANLWMTMQPSVLQKVDAIETFLIALQQGQGTEDQQQQAVLEVHRIAGLAGTFGLAEATQLARHIEGWLSTGASPQQLDRGQSWLAALRHELSASSPSSRINAVSTRFTPSSLPQKALKTPPKSSTVKALLAKTVDETKIHWTLTVFLITDNPALLTLVQSILEPQRIHLVPLQAWQSLWNTGEAIVPDALLIDLEAPGGYPDLDGAKLCRQVREDARWNKQPILFLTAHPAQSMMQELFASGADDFVSKAAIASELIVRIQARAKKNS
jgi:DNA-binding response OmpR family regulator/HPt (histidine-containing phosphotransfer) domain-containing protein